LPETLQLLIDRDDIGRFAAVDQQTQDSKHLTVLKTVKIVLGQHIADPVPSRIVQQQTAQHTGLRLDGMRRNTQLGNLTVSAQIIVQGSEYGRHDVSLRP